MVKNIFAISIPAVITMLSSLAVETINVSFVGNLGDTKLVAGVGLGNLIINVFGLGVLMGLNASLSTLIPQSYGAGDLRMCGTYLNRARIIAFLSMVPISIILMSGETILAAIG
jgi:Na+-driven multidrug efflux pump